MRGAREEDGRLLARLADGTSALSRYGGPLLDLNLD
jgi:hypothetical protein